MHKTLHKHNNKEGIKIELSFSHIPIQNNLEDLISSDFDMKEFVHACSCYLEQKDLLFFSKLEILWSIEKYASCDVYSKLNYGTLW